MNSFWMKSAVLLASCGSLVGCGSGSTREEPVNTDYSALRLAPSHEGALSYATSDEQLLRAVRNGLRMSLVGSPQIAAVVGISAPRADSPQGTFSSTTVQVDGVDEADLVKYDGNYIYTMRPQNVPASPGFTRNVLTVARTEPATAGTQIVSQFTVPGEQTGLPQLYQLQSEQGSAEFLAAISQDYRGWLGGPALDFMALQPDRTRIQLLDVRDPANVSQAWELQLDGWLRASRKIGDTLYLVNSYRPRLTGLQLPADSEERKRANELRVRNASAADLLPSYRENGGAKRQLLEPGDCVLAAGLGANDAYADLVVITAVDLSERRITDVNCVSTDVNGVYVSHDSLYVGGVGISIPEATVHLPAQVRAGRRRYQLSRQRRGRGPDRLAERVVLHGRARRQSAHPHIRVLCQQRRLRASPVHAARGCGASQLQAITILPNSLRTERRSASRVSRFTQCVSSAIARTSSPRASSIRCTCSI